MLTTDKAYCRELAQQLYDHGVRDAVLCPGSRDVPLIVAIGRHEGIKSISVVDERSAAFIALGIASIKSAPVAIVCTSGTAVLNFAPAVAEAYYRRIPLIVISADRPAEWIDQDDSQTIRQTGVLANIVKESYSVPVENGSLAQAWLANRTINDALLMSAAEPKGPVHINMHIDVPLGGTSSLIFEQTRTIKAIVPSESLNRTDFDHLNRRLCTQKKVLIIVGFMPPNEKISRALTMLSHRPNVAIMHEAQANVRIDGPSTPKIDSVLSTLSAEEKARLLPDIVITLGGSLVSRFVKKWLREGSRDMSETQYSEGRIQHWHIGKQPYSVDCFMSLDLRIEMDAEAFLTQLAAAEPDKSYLSDYSESWQSATERSNKMDLAYAESAPWSDYKAMSQLIALIPHGWNLQLSNGTAVRYVQLFDYSHIRRIDCNRGVSGIDGSTSTAIGAANAYDGTTLLITGDMSMQYDIGALSSGDLAPNLKIIVLNNSGGGIFRFIESTVNLPEREERLCCMGRFPLQGLAAAYDYQYFRVQSESEIDTAWPEFSKHRGLCIMEVVTPPQESAEILRKYFSRRENVS